MVSTCNVLFNGKYGIGFYVFVLVDSRSESERMGEKYTLEQILNAITQAGEEIVCAIHCKDREMLESVMEDYLSEY